MVKSNDCNDCSTNDMIFPPLFCQDLDTLLTTLIRRLRHAQSATSKAEAAEVARRFVRSVARVFVVLSIEMTPGKKL